MIIAIATDEDFAFIETWLHAEHVLFGTGFWNNRPQIARAHFEGRLLVLRVHGNAVAFHNQGETLCTDSIFAVHPNWRRAGLGTTFAEHLIEKATESGTAMLEINCSSTGSEPFWHALGFQLVDGHGSYQKHLLTLRLSEEAIVSALASAG